MAGKSADAGWGVQQNWGQAGLSLLFFFLYEPVMGEVWGRARRLFGCGGTGMHRATLGIRRDHRQQGNAHMETQERGTKTRTRDVRTRGTVAGQPEGRRSPACTVRQCSGYVGSEVASVGSGEHVLCGGAHPDVSTETKTWDETSVANQCGRRSQVGAGSGRACGGAPG